MITDVPTLRRSVISGDSSALANCCRVLFLFSIWVFFLLIENHRIKGMAKNEPAYICKVVHTVMQARANKDRSFELQQKKKQRDLTNPLKKACL